METKRYCSECMEETPHKDYQRDTKTNTYELSRCKQTKPNGKKCNNVRYRVE